MHIEVICSFTNRVCHVYTNQPNISFHPSLACDHRSNKPQLNIYFWGCHRPVERRGGRSQLRGHSQMMSARREEGVIQHLIKGRKAVWIWKGEEVKNFPKLSWRHMWMAPFSHVFWVCVLFFSRVPSIVSFELMVAAANLHEIHMILKEMSLLSWLTMFLKCQRTAHATQIGRLSQKRAWLRSLVKTPSNSKRSRFGLWRGGKISILFTLEESRGQG